MELKDIIRQRRKELGLTMLDIAKACDVSEATVSRWESGNIGDMKRSRIASLAKVLEISPSTIVGADDDHPLGDYYENVKHLKDQPELLELYENMLANDNVAILFDKVKKLSPEDLEQILRIVDTFNKEEM